MDLELDVVNPRGDTAVQAVKRLASNPHVRRVRVMTELAVRNLVSRDSCQNSGLFHHRRMHPAMVRKYLVYNRQPSKPSLKMKSEFAFTANESLVTATIGVGFGFVTVAMIW